MEACAWNVLIDELGLDLPPAVMACKDLRKAFASHVTGVSAKLPADAKITLDAWSHIRKLTLDISLVSGVAADLSPFMKSADPWPQLRELTITDQKPGSSNIMVKGCALTRMAQSARAWSRVETLIISGCRHPHEICELLAENMPDVQSLAVIGHSPYYDHELVAARDHAKQFHNAQEILRGKITTSCWTKLRRLILERVYVDDILDHDDGDDALLLGSGTLEKLRLGYMHMTVRLFRGLRRAARQRWSKLRKLRLDFMPDCGGEVWDESARSGNVSVWSGYPLLQDLDVNWSGLYGKLFADGEPPQNVATLSLAGNLLDTSSLQNLQQHAARMPSLWALDLSWNSLETRDIEVLAEALKQWPHLKFLTLNYTAIDAQAFLRKAAHPKLLILRLDGTKRPVSWCPNLARALKRNWPSLYTMHLGGVIDDVDKKKLVKAMDREGFKVYA